MRVIILAMLMVELFLPGVYSVAAVAELRGKPQCKNPKGKLGAASIFKCGQAVCKKSGKSGIWNICPANAKQTTVEEIQKSVNQTKTIVTETELAVKQIKKTVNDTEIKVKETDMTVKATKMSINEMNKTINVTELTVKKTEDTVNKIQQEVITAKSRLNEIEKTGKETRMIVTENNITVNKIETRSKETEITVNKIETRSKETETKLTEVEKIVKMLLQLTISNAILPVVYYEPQEFTIEKNNLMTTLDYYGPEFIVTFNLMLSTVPTGTISIIHLTIGGDNGVYGARTPGVWLYNKGFHIASAINGNKDFGKVIYPPIQAGQWIKFQISQLLIAGKFIFEVKVEDISYWEETNTDARPFANVQLFASDPWYTSAAGKIKELKVQTKRQ